MQKDIAIETIKFGVAKKEEKEKEGIPYVEIIFNNPTACSNLFKALNGLVISNKIAQNESESEILNFLVSKNKENTRQLTITGNLNQALPYLQHLPVIQTIQQAFKKNSKLVEKSQHCVLVSDKLVMQSLKTSNFWANFMPKRKTFIPVSQKTEQPTSSLSRSHNMSEEVSENTPLIPKNDSF